MSTFISINDFELETKLSSDQNEKNANTKCIVPQFLSQSANNGITIAEFLTNQQN